MKSVEMDIIKNHTKQLFDSSKLNPIYGKRIYLHKGCTGPELIRDQLLGYLGANVVDNIGQGRDVDILIIPYSSYRKLENNEVDDVVKSIGNMLNVFEKKSQEQQNPISDTLIISEHSLFNFISESFLKDDPVTKNHYKRLNFKYDWQNNVYDY